MTDYSRVYPHRESGLSEVIGFVLIIGLIVVVASLYLTYAVFLHRAGRMKLVI